MQNEFMLAAVAVAVAVFSSHSTDGHARECDGHYGAYNLLPLKLKFRKNRPRSLGRNNRTARCSGLWNDQSLQAMKTKHVTRN